MREKKIEISLEYFPPRSRMALDRLLTVNASLSATKPQFCSVTYGAGGSSQQGTLATVRALLQTGGAVVPHLTGVGLSKAQVHSLVSDYIELGVRQLLALRGDKPGKLESDPGDFRYASELVTYLRETFGDQLEILVAAYPDFHPESSSPKSDLLFFKQKVEAGANKAITQYFYNADSYFAFLEDAQKQSINIPIVPGILPISDYQSLMRFSNKCGAEVPNWIAYRLQQYQSDPASLLSFSTEIVTRLCERLLSEGAPGLHFYTLNKSEQVSAICENLSIGEFQKSVCEVSALG